MAFTAAVALTAVGLFFLGRRHGLAHGLYLYDYLSPTVVAMSIAAMYLLKDFSLPFSVGVLKRMSRLTLGIYLIHPLFLEWFTRCKFDGLLFPATLSVPVVATAAFLLSLLAADLASRILLVKRVI